MKSIAVASYSFSTSSFLREKLAARFPQADLVWNTTHQVLTNSELTQFLSGHSHAILGRETLSAELIKKLPELKIVSKYGVGLDSLNLEAMVTAGIQLGWKPGVNCRAVAELTLALFLMAIRSLHSARNNLVDGTWIRPRGRQLSEKTVGIIGCGHVGKDLIRLLAPFQVRVLTYDIRSGEQEYQEFFSKMGVEAVELDELLEQSDLVSIHTPKNASTLRLLDASKIGLMRPHSILVNTARGGLVDEAAVLAALEKNRLHAAAFDVFEEEPSENTALIHHPRFIGTPHIGGASDEAIQLMGLAAIDGLESPVDPITLKRYQ